jgi:hypothetical protein
VPEYLSPGVYVEEVELGSRPIEGVSTSTAGVVGVAERGPENVPVLITSFPEYGRIFGGYLDPSVSTDTWYLPYAVEGFFQNGGQRVYVVRVASDGATQANVELMDRGTPDGYASPLEVVVSPGDMFLLVADDVGLAGGEILRLDDSAATEYVTAAAGPFPATDTCVIALREPTYADYADTTTVTQVGFAGPDFNTTLSAATLPGATTITVAARPAAPDFARGDVLRIESGSNETVEFAIVEMVPTVATDMTITLRHPFALAHANAGTVERIAENVQVANTPLSQGVSAGTAVLVVGDATKAPANTVVRIGGTIAADPDAAYYMVADMIGAADIGVMAIDAPAAYEHGVAEVVNELTFGATVAVGNTGVGVNPGDTTLTTVAPFAIPLNPDDWIQIGAAEFAQVESIPATPPNTVMLRQPVTGTYAAPVAIAQAPRNPPAPATSTKLVEYLHKGGTTVLLADHLAPWDPATFVEIGAPDSPGREYRTLGAVGNLSVIPLFAGGGGNPATPVTRPHRSGTMVQLRNDLLEVIALDNGAWGDGLQVSVEDEDPALVQTTTTGAPPMTNVPLASTSGVEPGSLLEFIAVSTRLTVRAVAGQNTITVDSPAGIAPGARFRIDRVYPEYVTVAGPPVGDVVTLTQPLRRNHDARQWFDSMDTTGLPRMAKVDQLIGSNAVRLDGGGLPAAIPANTTVRSREFKVTVEWRKPNPRRPIDTMLIEAETHRYLSLDHRHSRYAPRIIGSVNGPTRLWDRRTEGGSDLVRISDPLELPDPAATEAIRLGPDLIYQTLPSGRRQVVPRNLATGNDDNAGVIDDTYRGVDNIDPLLRTGLFCLKNDEDISLVAIPGRVSDLVQGDVINHCELMHYRFALLDSIPGDEPTGAELPEVQAQRQQYDSKYAALYYPWVLRENPFPRNPAVATDLSVPPTGHMLGIYARTDVTRGVHKAPANELINGVTGLQRALTKGEQDVLNPEPTNINVLRDFRLQSRGLRVFGARVITSDPEWRYVNVRRLFNYVERSLELGTQWTVFEPNDQNLWAQVTRSISNFLNLVWRSGGLMGATAEEAYFVKCDTTTMSQADIDAGRLIVVIGIAPTKPAEFVVIRIGQWSGGSSVEEG